MYANVVIFVFFALLLITSVWGLVAIYTATDGGHFSNGETFLLKGEIAMKGEDFSLGGELLIRRPAIIYRYNVSPGRIITGKYSPGENFLGGRFGNGTPARIQNGVLS